MGFWNFLNFWQKWPENSTGPCLDHERSKFCQCKGQKGDKGEATWPRGLLPSTPTSHPCNHQRDVVLVGITLWCISNSTPGETPAVKAIEKYSSCMYRKCEGLTKVVEIWTKTHDTLLPRCRNLHIHKVNWSIIPLTSNKLFHQDFLKSHLWITFYKKS